jgi:hypothetical protein
LYVSFWLQLEAPSSALLSVAILAEPTRGQALEKAGFRFARAKSAVVTSLSDILWGASSPPDCIPVGN